MSSAIPARPTRGVISPLAPHGTTARAKGRPAQGIGGCNCPKCTAALRRYDTWRRLQALNGTPLTVPVAEVSAHLRLLMDAGAGWNQLQDATGSSSSTLAAILHGKYKKVTRGTAQRILALSPGDAVPPRRAVDATGSIRRARALMAAGHTSKVIASRAGVDHTVLYALINARCDTVTKFTAERIADAYNALSQQQGPNVRAIRRAQRLGWQDPLFWEDCGQIDNPEYDPASVTVETTSGAELAEEAAWMESHGYTREQAAYRLGVTKSYLDQCIRRWPQRYGEAA
ncbi:helix-turn-helix domain-containing protein [Streptomyces hoynatensis]|uniref:Helix-turn-helix DNA binding domain protein n=1 Tax=Streptomyces hoynatensis TaxID=1141874 RepID=A0A3A9Z012_9ACTN|nr:helix-turn-helix transcriptional regulator [Streptomyces hoynatensis]RKN40766.1 hypothetical protein D7294_16880 [Streptomyces hoynatensis]